MGLCGSVAYGHFEDFRLLFLGDFQCFWRSNDAGLVNELVAFVGLEPYVGSAGLCYCHCRIGFKWIIRLWHEVGRGAM